MASSWSSCLHCLNLSDRQPHCVGLEAVAVEPAEWSVLEEEGWLVNVTFNRHVFLRVLGHCSKLRCCSGKNVVVLDVFRCLFFFVTYFFAHWNVRETVLPTNVYLPVFTPSQFCLDMKHDWAPHFHEFDLNLHSNRCETFATRSSWFSKPISPRDGPHSKGGCWLWWIIYCGLVELILKR